MDSPAAIVTTLGILRPHPETKEFWLDAYFPFSSIDEIKANTGWDLRVANDAHMVPPPTPRELEVLRELTSGATNTVIAEHLYMSASTVKDHISHMLEKTGFQNRTELAVRARESGLVVKLISKN